MKNVGLEFLVMKIKPMLENVGLELLVMKIKHTLEISVFFVKNVGLGTFGIAHFKKSLITSMNSIFGVFRKK